MSPVSLIFLLCLPALLALGADHPAQVANHPSGLPTVGVGVFLANGSEQRIDEENAKAIFSGDPVTQASKLIDRFEKGPTWTCQKSGLVNLYLETLKRLKGDPPRLEAYLKGASERGAAKAYQEIATSQQVHPLQDYLFRFPLTEEARLALLHLILNRVDHAEMMEAAIYVRHYLEFYPAEKLRIGTVFLFSSVLGALQKQPVPGKDADWERVNLILKERQAELLLWKDESSRNEVRQLMEKNIERLHPEREPGDPSWLSLERRRIPFSPAEIDFASKAFSEDSATRNEYLRLLKLHPLPLMAEILNGTHCGLIDPLAIFEKGDDGFNEVFGGLYSNVPASLGKKLIARQIERGSPNAVLKVLDLLNNKHYSKPLFAEALVKRFLQRESVPLRDTVLNEISQNPVEAKMHFARELLAEYLDRGDHPDEGTMDRAVLSGVLSDLFLISPELGPLLRNSFTSPDEKVKLRAADLMARVSWAPEAALKEMREWLGHPDPKLRMSATHALMALGKHSPELEATIKELGDNKEWFAETQALRYFETLCREGFEFCDPTWPISFLKNAHSGVPASASQAIGCILSGKQADHIYASLSKVLAEGESGEKEGVLDAYANQVIRPEWIGELGAILKGDNLALKKKALFVLGTARNLDLATLAAPLHASLAHFMESKVATEEFGLALKALHHMGASLEPYRTTPPRPLDCPEGTTNLDRHWNMISAWIEADPEDPRWPASLREWMAGFGFEVHKVAAGGIWKLGLSPQDVLSEFERFFLTRTSTGVPEALYQHLPQLGKDLPLASTAVHNHLTLRNEMKSFGIADEDLANAIRVVGEKEPEAATAFAESLSDLLLPQKKPSLLDVGTDRFFFNEAVARHVARALAQAPGPFSRTAITSHVLPAFLSAKGMYGDSEVLLGILEKNASHSPEVRETLERTANWFFEGNTQPHGLPSLAPAGFALLGKALAKGYLAEKKPEKIASWFEAPQMDREDRRYGYFSNVKKIVAVSAAAEMDSDADALIPKIHALLLDPSPAVRFYAARALFKLQPDSLKDKEREIANLPNLAEPNDGGETVRDQIELMKALINRNPQSAVIFAEVLRAKNREASWSFVSGLLEDLFGTDGKPQGWTGKTLPVAISPNSPFTRLSREGQRQLLETLCRGIRDSSDVQAMRVILLKVDPKLWQEMPLKLQATLLTP